MNIKKIIISRWRACLKAGCLLLVAGLYIALPAKAQTTITQNNLIPNGSFDNGGTGWYAYASGTYYYNQTLGSETDSILSIGWWTGANVYQNTGAALLPGIDYVMTVRATPGTTADGVSVGLDGIDSGNNWTSINNTSFNFANPTTQAWQIFSVRISSNSIAPYVGETAGVACGEGGASDDWLWVDWVQLAPALPYFTSQPVGVTNYAGASAAFSAAAIGAVTNSAGPGSVITYQWYLAGNPVAHATNTAYAIPVLNATNAGIYYVVATSPYGSTQSSNVTLAVLPANPPVVTQPPASQNVYLYQTAQFSVTVVGTPPFYYQWISNSIPLTGATNTTLTLHGVSAASTGTYSVTITNQFGSVTTNASLTVVTPTAGTYEAAAINLQPQVYLRFDDINSTNWVFNEGTLGAMANATAEGNYVAATGPLPPSYPNFESTNPAVQFDGASADVAIPALNLATNNGNTVTLSAWIYCYGPQVNNSGVLFNRSYNNASGLQIQTDGSGNNILSYDWASGDRYQFSSGLIIPQYQWCFAALVITPTNATIYLQNGTSMQTAVDTFPEGLCSFIGNTYVGWDPVDGAGASTRRFSGIIDEPAIFNRSLSPTEVNTLFSSAVGSPAGIVTAPVGLTNYTGQPFQLSVVASGAPPLIYQWYQNGSPIPGATNGTYSVVSASITNNGNYYVYVQNTAGNTNSSLTPATVSILTSAPFFTTLPQPAAVFAGVPVSLAGVVNGSGPISYQWYQNNALLAGQTNASLYLADPEAGNAGNYVLMATNTYGQTNSQSVQLTVQSTGLYAITNIPGYSVESPAGAVTGTGVDQKTYSGTNQQWVITSVGGGGHKLISVASGLAVTTAGTYSQLVLQTYTGASNQLWSFMPTGNYYNLISVGSGEAMDDWGAGSGNMVALYPLNTGQNQMWMLTPIAPMAPTGLSAIAGNGQAGLTWNPSLGAASYNVQRATTSGGETIITNVSGTNYTDTGLINGTTYYYVVSAVDSAGAGANSSEASVTPVALPVILTSAPQSGGQFKLQFNGVDGQSYIVEMSTNLAAGNWVPVYTNTQSGGMFIYTDTTATSTGRFYRVKQP